MRIIISIISAFSLMLLMVPQEVLSAEEIANNTQINNKPSIVMNDSVLFDYPVDTTWIHTNDKYEAEYEGETFRFHPQTSGKYVVATGLYNVDVEDIVDNPYLPEVSLSMKSYVIENKGGDITITEGDDYYYPSYEPTQETQEVFEVKKRFYDFVEKEIDQDHYFEYIMIRGNIENPTPKLRINSTQNGVLTETYDYPGNKQHSFKLKCNNEISSTNLKRYTIQYTPQDITYSSSITTVHQIAKVDNETLTVYQIDVTNGELDPASLSIEKYKQGDVNGDLEFNISDVVLLQKWLLAVPNTDLANWKAADFCKDNKLDVFDLCLMKRALLDNIQNPVEPPADHIASLGFKTADDAIKEIIQSDLSEIEGYAQMFERFRNDGFIYHFTDVENAITLREDHPNAAVWLMPYDYFEDTGILYHVVYQGKDYQVYYYFTAPAFPASDLWDYMEQRLHTDQVKVVDGKYGIVHHPNGGQPVVSAYFAIDDTHYCKVKTFEQEDALMDFLQVLNYEKLDIADNREVFVPVNSSDTDLDKSAIAGKIFAYEKEGAGGYCTLSFNENGRFLYSPGKLSSYMDGGDWKVDGDTVSLIGMENKTIYLKITDDTLIYIAEGSDEFPYMDIKDGEKFVIYRPEISSDMFQLNSRYTEYGLGDPKVGLNLIVSELPKFCYVENVRLYDEDDNFIGTMSPATDADIWSYLVDCHVTEECSKTYYTLTNILCGAKPYLDDVRSEITVNFKVTPAP